MSKIISGAWRLLEADLGVQPGTVLLVTHNMNSCMSIRGFDMVRISIIISNITSGSWRPLEADPGGNFFT